MEIFNHCPNCRSTDVDDLEDGEDGQVVCNKCGWEGYDSWLVRDDGTNEGEEEETDDN